MQGRDTTGRPHWKTCRVAIEKHIEDKGPAFWECIQNRAIRQCAQQEFGDQGHEETHEPQAHEETNRMEVDDGSEMDEDEDKWIRMR